MAENKTPLATVAGKNIYADNLNELINQLPPQQQMYFRSREGRRALLDELIAQNLMYEEALANDLQESSEFQVLLKDAEEKLLKTMAIANFMKDITVEDEEAEKYFKENPDQFVSPPAIRASHILVETEEEADKIIKELEAGEKSFEEAAKEFSTCPSAPQGGDLNYFQRGQMVPEFEEAAFALKPGEMTEKPVKTQFGYHIIKKTDEKEPESLPYQLVKDSIKDFLLAQKQDQEFKKHIEELKEKYPVEINNGMI